MNIKVQHKNYTLSCYYDKQWINEYSNGEIASLKLIQEGDSDNILVCYRSGETYTWKSKYIDAYNIAQFGVAVSSNGKFVFAQTWENGLFCIDAKTGECIWRTKSKRGITSIFVNDDTIVCQQHHYAMQLIDMNTGEVLKEKRPSTAYDFNSLDNRHIICQSNSRKWEIIESETLDVKESFTHKEFTGGHTDKLINHISLGENGIICVRQITTDYANDVEPPKMITSVEFEHLLKSNYLSNL